ncbi:MAG: hypothetical protein NT087_10200 [Deltaproteobacteria bacterium]|nr:hypothetical protein [Deltaproteobacteria bacterium]
MVLLALLAGAHNVPANDKAYDDAEALRRADKQWNQIDKAQQDAASQRYDATHSSSSTTSGDSPLATVFCFGIAILSVNGIIKAIRKDIAKNKAQAKATKDSQDKLAKATSLGFSFDNETKECSACAETIKLRASKCKYCQKEFSAEDMEKANIGKIDAFLQAKRQENDQASSEQAKAEATHTAKSEGFKAYQDKIAKAKMLGFSINNETKECPTCSNLIKAMARTCNHCQNGFSNYDINIVIVSKVDAFLEAKHESA